MPSTVIRRHGYDETRQLLDITFQSGRLYRYCNVPQNIAEALDDASSKGEFFNAFIRDHFRYEPDTGNPN